MQYFYAILWFAIGLILIFSISKENKIFYFAGGFFLLLGVVAGRRAAACSEAVRRGLGIALKCVTGVALVVLAVCFVQNYKKGRKQAAEDEASQKKE